MVAEFAVKRVELRLRAMAHRETRAQASTYRFSAETLRAAVAAPVTDLVSAETLGQQAAQALRDHGAAGYLGDV